MTCRPQLATARAGFLSSCSSRTSPWKRRARARPSPTRTSSSRVRCGPSPRLRRLTTDRLTLLRDRAVRGAFASALRTDRLGRVIEYHDVIATTMDRASELVAAGTPDGTVVVADHQTAGRGRRGRSWGYGPAGSLLMASWILRVEGRYAPLFTVLSAVALLRAARGLGVEGLSVKWPNDLWLSGRKVAGALSVNAQDPQGERWLVLGTGIDTHTRDHPEEVRDAVTSFAREGYDVDRLALLARLAFELEPLLDGGQAARAEAAGEWRRASNVLGRRVRIEDGARRFEADAVDLDADRALLGRTEP